MTKQYHATAYDISEVIDCLDDIILFQGTAKACAEEYIEYTALLHDMPENLSYYFDVEVHSSNIWFQRVKIGGYEGG